MSADRAFLEQIIPISLDKLIEMSSMKESITDKSEVSEGLKHCQACSTKRHVDELSRCKGCEAVWYCDKVSETVGIAMIEGADLIHRIVR